jgi:hypothetical protein
MNVALIDDQALSAVLRGRTPRALRRRQLATTGLWYVRLCRAALARRDLTGVLSQPFAELPDEIAGRARSRLVDLPDEIDLMSFRELGPTVGRLQGRHALNILGMEVVASALTLGADVYLSASSPRLEAALAIEGRSIRHLD